MTTRLSGRLYAACRLFTTEPDGFVLPTRKALEYDKRSFEALCKPSRGYVEWVARLNGFRLTREGREAVLEFENANIVNKTHTWTFGAYLRGYADALNQDFRPRTEGKRAGNVRSISKRRIA